MTEIIVQELGCLRCFHHWVPRKARVKICPKCKTTLWDVPKGQNRLVSVKPKRVKVT